MAKTLSEAPITTRNAREKLAVGLHWRGIDPETHLGYRKGKRGGVWLVRWRNGTGYRQERLGTADDAVAEGTLAFADAVKAARARVEAARREAKAVADGPVQTVRTAVLAYMASRDARDSTRKGRAVRSDATHRLERYVVGKGERGNRKAIPAAEIADVALHELTEPALKAWRDGLPSGLKMATRQRLINDLKAALNAAASAHRGKLPTTLSGVIQHGLKAGGGNVEQGEPVARDSQILSDSTVGRIIAAAGGVDEAKGQEGDFARLIIVLAATGARFSQVARLRVGDVQRAAGRIMVPTSRKGRGGGKSSHTPVPVGRDVLDALLPATTGRPADAFLLERWRFEQRGGIAWHRTERGPWGVPAEIVRHWAAIRREVGLGADVVPYALRHSSIVRGIRAGLPIRLVAALHDTSTAMIERTYSRHIAGGLEEMAAAAVVPLMPTYDGKVIRIAT
jgi:integrase